MNERLKKITYNYYHSLLSIKRNDCVAKSILGLQADYMCFKSCCFNIVNLKMQDLVCLTYVTVPIKLCILPFIALNDMLAIGNPASTTTTITRHMGWEVFYYFKCYVSYWKSSIHNNNNNNNKTHGMGSRLLL